MIYSELTKKAMKICYNAHRNQSDGAGLPYVFHPLHLAEQMDGEFETCTALLHDVVEDTNWTIEDLEEAGFPLEVTQAVAMLTHDRDEPYMEYVLRLRGHDIARKVKISDLTHNCDYSRLNEIRSYDRKRHRKYRIALALLEKEDQDPASGRTCRDLPLHDDRPWFLRVYYPEKGPVREASIIGENELFYDIRSDTDLLWAGCPTVRRKTSFPERLSDYLEDHGIADLGEWFDRKGISYRKGNPLQENE